MFQKLYRHLEEANATLRRQENVLQENASQAQDIVRLLEVMNENARIYQDLLRQNSKRATPAVPVILSIGLLLSFGVILFLSIRLSRLNDAISTNQQAISVSQQTVNGRQRDMAAQLTRLDSIISGQGKNISEQSQHLLQLRDLNEVSARSVSQIKNKIDQTNRLVRLLRSDSARPIMKQTADR